MMKTSQFWRLSYYILAAESCFKCCKTFKNILSVVSDGGWSLSQLPSGGGGGYTLDKSPHTRDKQPFTLTFTPKACLKHTLAQLCDFKADSDSVEQAVVYVSCTVKPVIWSFNHQSQASLLCANKIMWSTPLNLTEVQNTV